MTISAQVCAHQSVTNPLEIRASPEGIPDNIIKNAGTIQVLGAGGGDANSMIGQSPKQRVFSFVGLSLANYHTLLVDGAASLSHTLTHARSLALSLSLSRFRTLWDLPFPTTLDWTLIGILPYFTCRQCGFSLSLSLSLALSLSLSLSRSFARARALSLSFSLCLAC